MNRRQFIKKSVAAGAILGFPTIVPSTVFGANAPSNRVTVGHVGCGSRGHAVFGSIKQSAQYIGVCDPFKSRREEYAKAAGGDCKMYSDFREMLARDDIDAISIATQDSWHVPLTIAAVKAGKDVYCEKPLGVSIEENKACLAAVRRYGRMFQYGTQQRSTAHCRKGCELVRNGRMGKLHTINVLAPNGVSGGGGVTPIAVPDEFDYNMWLGPIPYSPYTSDRCTPHGTYFVYDNSLGFIAGWGAHPLDIAIWGYDFSKAGSITVEGTGKIPTTGIFNCVYDWDVIYKFDNGLTMTLKPGGDHTTFIGDEGYVGVCRNYAHASTQEWLSNPLEPGEEHLVDSSNHGGNFVESVRTRKDPVSNIDDAAQSDLFSHLGDIAIRCGRKIRWDAKKQTIVGDDTARRMMTRAMRSPWTI